jgi:hypothetical protein
MITLYPDIVIASFRTMNAARAAATARAAGEPPGRSPCGDRATGKREEETLTGCRAVSRHMVPPPMAPDIGQLTDIGDSGAKVRG